MHAISTKLLWTFFSGAGAPFVFYIAPGKHEWVHAAAVISIGLAMLFFSRERIEDERVEHLKLKALKVSLVVAVNATLVLNMWVLNPEEPDRVSRSLSAFDFLAIAMLCALGLFHYWRWQDGRESVASEKVAS